MLNSMYKTKQQMEKPMNNVVFEYLGNESKKWREMAEALAYNASILTQHRLQHQTDRDQARRILGIGDVEMTFTSLVLWGYAVECFLKCLRLKRGHPLVVNGQIVWIMDHNLEQMAREVSFRLNDSQQRIMKNLTMITRWSGRYPIGTSAKSISVPNYWQEPDDDIELEDILQSLRQEIDS